MRSVSPTDDRLRARPSRLSGCWLGAHESQQKPLKPGSATQRLADALGSREISGGEKAGR